MIERLDEEDLFDIADWFLMKERMTHRKLQDLLYYSQAWNLALTEYRLMNTHFQAWKKGPICPEIYRKYEEWKGIAIITVACQCPVFKKERTERFLESIFRLYGKYSEVALTNNIKSETPYLNARRGYEQDAITGMTISEKDMISFYGNLLQNQ